MKNKIKSLRSRKYLFLFVLVMVLNVLLSVALSISFGQTKIDDFTSQKPVKVDVIEQKNCPILITLLNVDNSPITFQNINYNLQNSSNKAIRAITFLADGKKSGKVITTSFATELFSPGKSKNTSIPLERQNLVEDETVLLSIDYVEFEDGNTWGNDVAGKSIALAGERAGRNAAIKSLKILLSNEGFAAMSNYLKKDITEINFDVPNLNSSDEWKKGFKLGYRSVISILQSESNQNVENLTKKLDEMEKIAK